MEEKTPTPSDMAKALGRRGGHARAKNLTKEQLTAIGKKGAKKRWAKKSKGGEGR